jgi:hypothetical protein
MLLRRLVDELNELGTVPVTMAKPWTTAADQRGNAVSYDCLVMGKQAPRRVPAGWPPAVPPPGSEDWEDWEAAVVAFPVKFFCSTDSASAGLLGRRLCHPRLALFPRATDRR